PQRDLEVTPRGSAILERIGEARSVRRDAMRLRKRDPRELAPVACPSARILRRLHCIARAHDHEARALLDVSGRGRHVERASVAAFPFVHAVDHDDGHAGAGRFADFAPHAEGLTGAAHADRETDASLDHATAPACDPFAAAGELLELELELANIGVRTTGAARTRSAKPPSANVNANRSSQPLAQPARR